MRTFVCLALLFGTAFCLVTPPFYVLDESVHFNHAYHFSRGQLKAAKLNDKYYGGHVSAHIDQTIQASLDYRNKQPGFKTAYLDNFEDLATDKTSDARALSIYNSTAVYTPVAYLPQASGILLGRVFRASAIGLMYLGRLFNLLVWVLLVALAIRLLPFGKWGLVIIALLPTSVFQAASLSADATTTGLAFLAAATIFRLAVTKQVLSRNRYLLLGLLMLLLTLTKQSYFCFVFLLFALPMASFKSRREYWLKNSAVGLICLTATGLWSWAVHKIDILIPLWPDHPFISMSAQAHKLLVAPQHFSFATWSSYLTGRADITLTSLVGQYGRIYDLRLPLLLVIMAYFLVAFALLREESIKNVRKLQPLRLVSSLVLGLSLLTLTGILYLTFSTVGGHYVDGIQARYFLPLLILLIPLAKLRKSRLLKIQVSPTLLIGGSSLLLVVSLFMMVHRFYYAFA